MWQAREREAMYQYNGLYKCTQDNIKKDVQMQTGFMWLSRGTIR
jgi:hypothetical protein